MLLWKKDVEIVGVRQRCTMLLTLLLSPAALLLIIVLVLFLSGHRIGW
jgi:hypothetical protein